MPISTENGQFWLTEGNMVLCLYVACLYVSLVQLATFK